MHTVLRLNCAFLGSAEAQAQHWVEVAPLFYFETSFFLILKIAQHLKLILYISLSQQPLPTLMCTRKQKYASQCKQQTDLEITDARTDYKAN